MDAKTRIEDDIVLFSSLGMLEKAATFRYINAAGIHTIEDFMTVDISKFPQRSTEAYSAVQSIFRYAYLNEDLAFDETIRKTYNISYEGYLEAAKDLAGIGFANYNPTKINSILTKNGFDKKSSDSVNMETILNSIACRGEGIIGSIANFYIDHIHGIKNWETTANITEAINDSDELRDAKAKLKALDDERKSINDKIRKLRETIKNLEEEQTKNAKR